MRLPNSVECEKSLLGCVILDNAILPKITVKLDDFYDSKHRAVFGAMLKLQEAGKPIDFPSLATELGNDTTGASDIGFLAELMDASASSANFEHYANVVSEKAKLRDVIALASDLHNKCMDAVATKEVIVNLLNSVQTTLVGLTPKDNKGSGMLAKFIEEQVKMSIDIKEGKVENKAVKTGFLDIDVHIDGLIPGNMIVIAARPGVGKTAFALDIVLNLIKKGMAASYYSLEMTCSEIARRLISKQVNIGLKNLMNGLLGEDDIQKLSSLSVENSMDNLFITEKNTTPAEIESDIDKWNAEHPDKPMRCVIVDHLQLVGVHDSRAYERRDLQLGKYTALLKDIAKRKELTVILLSQLNRALDARNKDEKLPKLSDLRDSGSIEQDADVVLGLYRRALDTQDPTDNTGTCIILKNRNGRVGRVNLTWIPHIASYRSKARDESPQNIPTREVKQLKPIVNKDEPTRVFIDPDTNKPVTLF